MDVQTRVLCNAQKVFCHFLPVISLIIFCQCRADSPIEGQKQQKRTEKSLFRQRKIGNIDEMINRVKKSQKKCCNYLQFVL